MDVIAASKDLHHHSFSCDGSCDARSGNFPICTCGAASWSEELARYCFVWIVFLGGAVGLSRGTHLGVDLLVNAFPEVARRRFDALTNTLVAIFAATVIYASLPVLNINMFQRSPALGIQMSYIYMAIPISMGIIFLICSER